MRTTSRRQFLLTAIGGLAASDMASGLLSGRAAAAPEVGDDRDAGTGLRRVTRSSWALGSKVSITALHERGEVAGQAISAAFAELRKVDELMSLYRPESQLCRLNREGRIDRPHPYLVTVLERARTLSNRTAGAFDVTVQPLWQLYAAAKQAGRLPDAAALERARRTVGWRRIEIAKGWIRLPSRDMAVTLNGIAQGFAADRALAVLRDRGIEHALVDTGEIGTVGRKPGGEAWKVGIQHPRRDDAYISLARLAGRCLATSGDYETSFSPDHAYNHIFDPATGRSPDVFSSVTVLAPSGIDADALSTAIFVMGIEKGLKLVQSTPDTEALFVLKNGRTLATAAFPQAS